MLDLFGEFLEVAIPGAVLLGIFAVIIVVVLVKKRLYQKQKT